MTRAEGRAWFANVLLERIRKDRRPSATHMDMVEQALQDMPELLPQYMQVLIDKVGQDNHPSIPMLQRIRRLAEDLPAR